MSNLDRRNLLKGLVLGAITPLESLKGLMEPDIPVIKFGLTRAPIPAKTRKLVGKWTLEPFSYIPMQTTETICDS